MKSALVKSRTVFTRLGIVVLVALSLACESSNPTSPSAMNGASGAGAGSVPGGLISEVAAADGSTLKVSAPVPQSPVNNAEVETLLPPLNAMSSQSEFVSGIALPHEFQVYRVEANGDLTMVDSGTVPLGGEITTHTVQTELIDDTPHQWKARAVFQGAHGPWSEMAAFETNVPAEILTPTPLQPASGDEVNSVRPVLEVENPVIKGDPGPVMIEFEVATDSQFLNIVAVIAEEMGKHAGINTPLTGPRQTALSREQRTSAQLNVDLEKEARYYWRARGTNGSVDTFPTAAAPAGSVVGEFSQTVFFTVAADAETTLNGGGGGGGAVSSGTASDELDLSQVVWLHTNVSSWPQTSTITSTTIGAPPICINHTKLGQWATGDFSGSGAIVDSNVWVFANIGGTWYAATWEWLRAGTTCKDFGASDFRTHVNGASPLSSWTPQSGETIGLMVSTPARLGPAGPGQRALKCRAQNVAVGLRRSRTNAHACQSEDGHAMGQPENSSTSRGSSFARLSPSVVLPTARSSGRRSSVR